MFSIFICNWPDLNKSQIAIGATQSKWKWGLRALEQSHHHSLQHCGWCTNLPDDFAPYFTFNCNQDFNILDFFSCFLSTWMERPTLYIDSEVLTLITSASHSAAKTFPSVHGRSQPSEARQQNYIMEEKQRWSPMEISLNNDIYTCHCKAFWILDLQCNSYFSINGY